MKKVLFVDDEPSVLDALRRMLHPLRTELAMDFAASGRQALRMLSETTYDVLVTDVVMPDVDGIGVLTESARSSPQTVRIVLSGNGDYQTTLRAVTLAHQYLIKPCDAATLRTTVENALVLSSILDNGALTALLGRVQSLPSVPSVYLRLMDAVQGVETSPAAIGDIIAEDLGMSAKILQWVNSPLFGACRPVASPKEAVIYMGVDLVRAIALTESVFSQFDEKNRPGFCVEELRDHSLQVAALAREIARSGGMPPAAANNVFLGGLMHDLGKLVLGCNFPREYKDVTACFQEPAVAREKERDLFGTTHAEVGGYLLWLWGIPRAVTEIVLRHHTAGQYVPEAPDAAAVVQLADTRIRQGARPAPVEVAS